MRRGAIYGLTAASIWGGMYVVSDIVLQTIPPFSLLTMRLLLGAVVLAILVWRRTGATRPTRRDVLRFTAVGFVGFGVSVGAQFVGTDLSNAVNGALVTSASPAFIILFAVLLLHERLTRQRVLAVTLATIGVIVIVDPTQADFSEETFVGNIVLAVAAITWGLYSVLVRHVMTSDGESSHDTMTVTLIGFIGGLLLTIPAAMIEAPHNPIGEITIGIVLGVLYLGVISTAGAMWLWTRAFTLVEASTASLFFFAQPLVGALLGALIGQPITLDLMVGSVLIMTGVLLSIGRGAALRRMSRRPSSVWVQSSHH